MLRRPQCLVLAALACGSLALALALAPAPAGAVTRGAVVRDRDGLRGSVVGVEGTAGERCSGSLIAPDLVLTAAHCVMRGGRYFVFVTERDFRQRRIGAAAVTMHPAFVPGTTPEDQPGIDLAILKLAEAPGPDFTPLAAGRSRGIDRGEPVEIAGYGSVDETRPSFGHILRQARLVGLGEMQMRNRVTTVGDGRRLAKTPGAGACVGDSGGPILRGGRGGYELVGVVSWSSGAVKQNPRALTACGGLTAVTPVGENADWIAATAASLGRAAAVETTGTARR